MSIPDEYKVEHLFLLIGENPLPNYVAAKTLLAEGGKPYLVFTEHTQKPAKRLQEALGLSDKQMWSLDNNESDAAEIKKKIREIVKTIQDDPDNVNKKQFGLNYTGGTKAMAVHAYQALLQPRSEDPEYKLNLEPIFSYLDSRRLMMLIDKISNPAPLDIPKEKLDFSLEKLFKLHGFTLSKPPKIDVTLPQLVNAINWLDDEQTEYNARLPQSESRSVNINESLAPESLKIAKNIAARIIRKKLDVLLLKQVSSIGFINKEKISNSQLSRLMIITRKALSELEIEQEKPEPERKTITELAEPIRELLRNLPSNARNQFESATLTTGEKLDEQIHTWINPPYSWLNNSWRSDPQTRNLVVSGQPIVSIAGVPQGFDNYTALEYSLRLIIAVSKKIMKEKNND